VIYDAEHSFDGYSDAPEYALQTWQAADLAGADIITLCDTNGGRLPHEVAEVTALARKKLKARIGIHTHDDIGLGVANALSALEAGATHVQGTVNGYGERTGNCNLTSVIPNLVLKLKKSCLPAASLRKLREVSQFVDEIANVRHNPRLPWVGSAAFSHKGGQHVNAVQKLARSYEHVDPGKVGNVRRVLISDLAGRSNIVMKAQELGFKLSNETPELKEILNRIKKLEHEGYEFEAAEGSLALVIRKILKHQEPPFHIDGYHVSVRRDRASSVCQASVKVQVDGVVEHTIAEGDGPINALDQALRSALSKFYPQLKKVKLSDYKVRILDSNSGTGARTRVLIESTNGQEDWGTVGVHDNIIEASLQALSDSIEYALEKR
jgi:2-isopropylmalate synthase